MAESKAGYTCRFLSEPPNLFKCEICRLVLREPQLTECCGKNACQPCIAKEAEDNKPCPIPGCRESCVKINFNRDLHFDILQNTVYCSSKETGCEWMDKLENLNKHLEICPHVEVECRNFCGLRIQRRMIEDHETICERFRVSCHQCGDLYERRDCSIHLKVCLFTKVKCPFSIVGCTSEVLNKDLQQHFDESLSKHLALVAKQSHDVKAKIGESNVLFQKKEKLASHMMDVATFNEGFVITKAEVSEIQKAFKEAEDEFEELQRKHEQVVNEIEQLTIERDATICSLVELKDRSVFESKVHCYGPALPQLHPGDITSRPISCPVTTDEYIPRVLFKIQAFNKERKNDALICLPPFFSHNGGYKMCLAVYCNGFHGVKGDSLSIYVCLLKGKYDDYLDWPMRCKVVIEVLSVQRSRNISKTIEVQSKCRVLRNDGVTSSNMFGNCLRFMNLSFLTPPSCYLSDGCLNIAVARVF